MRGVRRRRAASLLPRFFALFSSAACQCGVWIIIGQSHSGGRRERNLIVRHMFAHDDDDLLRRCMIPCMACEMPNKRGVCVCSVSAHLCARASSVLEKAATVSS